MSQNDTPDKPGSAKAGGRVPVLTAKVDPREFSFESGAGFWAAIEKIATDESLCAQMDQAMEGHSAPRVWLILHEPGEPECSAAAAMAFAHQLGNRDQVALVLDCDDRGLSLTRWAEREESEGWIDLARYGISLLAAGLPMPFAGRQGYFLGVGSFAPTDVSDEEIQTVLHRLRRQADDLILVASADDTGLQWAASAHIRLLCWNQAARPASELDGLVNSLASSGCQLTGLLGMGESSSPEAPLGGHEPVEDASPEIAPMDDALTEGPKWSPGKLGEEDDEVWAATTPRGEAEARKGTSGVFWFLATAAVVIVAIMGVYWFQYVREPESVAKSEQKWAQQETGRPQTAPSQTEQENPVERLQDNPAAGDMANGDDVADDAEILNTEAVADSIAAVVVDTAAVDTDTTIVAEALPIAEAELPTAETEETGFDMVPYRGPVGTGGWALHLYSLNSSAGADVETTELHRRGFETEVRIVEKTGSGRLWRVYVGSFATRAGARAAAPLLKEELRTDWANPTRF